MNLPFATDTPTDDRWLRAWAVDYAAVGGAVAAAAVVPAWEEKLEPTV